MALDTRSRYAVLHGPPPPPLWYPDVAGQTIRAA